jgi:thiamine monophosphate synthase
MARDVALLIENDAARAERIGADGVHIPADAVLYGHARAPRSTRDHRRWLQRKSS